MTLEFLALLAVGFLAQLVDGALGMAFGLISTTALLSLGVVPAQASAVIHMAEIATTGASGLSHLFHRNVDRRLLLLIAVPGVLGGALGAWILSNVDGRTIRPFVSAYLLAMGLFILLKVTRPMRAHRDVKPRHAAPLGLAGGFLDAIGSGGWGPMVTSTLIGTGQAPRQVIGSVNAAEFFVTTVVAATFLLELVSVDFEHVVALAIGGVLAAPFGAWITHYVPARGLMAAVGLTVSALALFQLARSF